MRHALVFVLAGCALRTTTVNPGELAAHAPAFAQTGRAELLRDNGNVTVSADEVVTVHIHEGEGLQRSETLTVRELVAGCNLVGQDAECLARRVIDEPVLRHHERHFDSTRAATLAALGGLGGLAGYCVAECRGDSNVEQRAAYTAGFVGGMLALGVLLLLIVE